MTFTVVANDAGENRAAAAAHRSRPARSPGSAVTIDIPLDGLDPDGDSVMLDGHLVGAATSAASPSDTSTSITYEAFAGSTGTDTLQYEVRDAFGATAKGTIRIGVIPRPAVRCPPNAVDDAVEMKPGRTSRRSRCS